MIDKISKIIANYKTFVLTSHESLDGDAVGSLIAMREHLMDQGKSVQIFAKDKVPYFLNFLKGAEAFVNNFEKIREADVLIALDCAEYHRIGIDIKKAVKPTKFINIDHHKSNTEYADINLIEDCSCTGELVLKVIDKMNGSLNINIANALYVSVLTDTGSFKYSGTSPEALLMASRFVQAGASPWRLTASLYENNPPQKLRLLVDVLSTLYVDKCGLFATVDVTTEMLKKNNATYEMTDGLVNYPRSIAGVEVAVLFRELDGDVKLSVRSVGNFDVGDFCTKYDGGGHKNAAGCFVKGSLGEVKMNVINELQSWVKSQNLNQD
jgi:phosphoesterase RecJ-like protein